MQRKNRQKTMFIGVSLAASVVAVSMTAYAIAAPPKSKATKPTVTKAANPPAPSAITNDNTPLTEEQKIVHVLNRLGFGPRPGDVAKVQQMGLSTYIDLQLSPEKINDGAVDTKLAPLTLLKQTPDELASTYYERQKKIVKTAKARATAQTQGVTPETMQSAEVTPQKKAAMLREAYQSMTPDEQQALRDLQAAQKKIRDGGIQLSVDKAVRAAESEKQLQEVLVDFWSNHFNIDVNKGSCAVYKIADERDVIRPNLFGKFRDILGASAKSPAMLFYLDNAQSQVPQPDNPRRDKMQAAFLQQMQNSGNPGANQLAEVAKAKRKGGINENYAREIMELHTLGVDGGYTQKDVQEVARCSHRLECGQPAQWQDGANGFQLMPRNHDNGEKTVLGHALFPRMVASISDGEKILDLLASHPSTIRHLFPL